MEPTYRIVESSLIPPLKFWFNWRFEGFEHVPREGPVLVAANHISYLDPLAHGYFLVKAKRRPRYLAKSELYGNPFLRFILDHAKQVKVERGTGSTAPVDAALRALADDQCVVVYPEGTVTRNPDRTPMQGKTGVARITLRSGVPVLPLAVWGSQHVWQRDGAHSLKFGRPIWVAAGPPLDFSEYEDGRDDPTVLRAVTDQVTDELARLVADLRTRYPKRWA